MNPTTPTLSLGANDNSPGAPGWPVAVVEYVKQHQAQRQ
jgi:hypothetical protein